MRKLSLVVVTLFVSALFLTACGGETAATPTTAPAAPTTAVENTPAAAADTPTTAAAEPTAAATETTAAAAETPASTGETKTAIIGFTASQTGNLNVESTRQINGTKLWVDQINKAGGIKLKDGTAVKFDTKFYDDQSNKDRVQELYTRLATQDNADFLISPYSSGLADAAAVIAEQYGKVMVTTGAASDSTYQKGYTLVYQAYTPASRYLTGAADLLANLDSAAKKLAIVHENDKFSTDVAKALRTYAEGKGFNIVMDEGYDTGTTDFAPFINKIQQAAPEIIMGGGHFQDGSTFARQLSEKKVPVKFLSLLVAPPEPSFAEIGDAAVGVIGPSQWEPGVAYNEDAAKKAGLPWFGTSSDDFATAYQAAYNEEPSYHAAGGYAAALILQKAIEDAGSLDKDAIKAAMDKMDVLTFFGHIKFNTTAESHGLQVGHEMVYIQWQKDDSGKLVKKIVWPAEGANGEAVYPLNR
jgi:ABC-type branched-subunit amino acid transport system substrate-binding protein